MLVRAAVRAKTLFLFSPLCQGKGRHGAALSDNLIITTTCVYYSSIESGYIF